jgi:hypothetical protein
MPAAGNCHDQLIKLLHRISKNVLDYSAPFNAGNHLFNDDTYSGNNRIKGLL